MPRPCSGTSEDAAGLKFLWSLRSCLLFLRLGRISQPLGSRQSPTAVDANAPRSDKNLSGDEAYDNHAQESLMIDEEVWLGHLCLCPNGFLLKMYFVKGFPSLGGSEGLHCVLFFS